MTAVLLDTNILLQDPTLRGAHIRKLLIGCKRCGFEVLIPDVVRDELAGNHKQHVLQHLRKIEGSVKELARFDLAYTRPVIDFDKEAAAYGERVDAVFKKYDAKYLKYPNVTLQQVVRAAYDNKKPFKTTGEGHKDYLVFRTAVEFIQGNEKDLRFLTHNGKDFCGTDGALHPDLKAELPPNAHVTVYESAQSFYSEFLAAEVEKVGHLNEPEAIIAAIENGTFPGFDLGDKLEAILIRELIGGHPNLESLQTPLDDLSATQLVGFSVDDIEVSALDQDLLSMDIEGDVELEVFGFMEKYAYFGASEELDVSLDNADWNDYVVSAYDTASGSFVMSLVFNQTEHEVVSVDVEID